MRRERICIPFVNRSFIAFLLLNGLTSPVFDCLFVFFASFSLLSYFTIRFL
jgi:hypothetical protein